MFTLSALPLNRQARGECKESLLKILCHEGETYA